MKALLFEKLVCVWCPLIFGVVFLIVALQYQGDPIVKVLIGGFGLLFICFFCIAYLLAKIIKSPSDSKVQTN